MGRAPDDRRVRLGISGSYGGFNLGDEAILHSIVQQLRRDFPLELTVFSHDPQDTAGRHRVDHVVQLEELRREEMRERVREFDLFVLGGGGILYDGAEVHLHNARCAQELGVPVAVYAVGAGPLKKESNRQLLREVVERAALVTVRDNATGQLLEQLGVSKEVVVTADPALLLEAEEFPQEALVREGLADMDRLVGFSVREPGPAAPDIDTEHYHALLANVADFAVDRFDADIVFVPMERGQQDVQHGHAVLSRMQFPQRGSVLRGEYSAPQILSLASRFTFASGMRLHFLIFAAVQQVPFVALPYASKVQGFVREMGMEMPPLEKVTPGHLLAHLDRCWDERELLRASIREHLDGLQARARQTHELVAELIREAVGSAGREVPQCRP